jgi:hypothetical protein
VNDILPGAVSGVTCAFCAVGDNGATPAAIAAPVAPPMRTGGEYCMGVFCHYGRGKVVYEQKVVYEHVLGG